MCILGTDYPCGQISHYEDIHPRESPFCSPDGDAVKPAQPIFCIFFIPEILLNLLRVRQVQDSQIPLAVEFHFQSPFDNRPVCDSI